MLEKEIFKTVVKNTPLVSIDLCIVWDGKILLGKKNEPLKEFFYAWRRNSKKIELILIA